MNVLLDTGIFAAILDEDAVGFDLSSAQRYMLAGGRRIFVSPISFYEIAQKVRIGKWAEMMPYAHRLTELARESNIGVRVLNGPILSDAALLEWDHRDPFDRIIVATARHGKMRLVTNDRAIVDFYAAAVA